MDENELNDIGVYQYGYISTTEISFGTEIRDICKSNACRLYNTTWACPPAVGTIDDCKRKCLSYNCAMLFSSKYPLDDSFDFDGMRIAHAKFRMFATKFIFLHKNLFLIF